MKVAVDAVDPLPRSHVGVGVLGVLSCGQPQGTGPDEPSFCGGAHASDDLVG
jgi:hypothetical protein